MKGKTMSKADNERRAVVAWLERRLSKFRYSNNWSTKFNADVTGETDCSGATYCAYQSIGRTIGHMSNGTQSYWHVCARPTATA